MGIVHACQIQYDSLGNRILQGNVDIGIKIFWRPAGEDMDADIQKGIESGIPAGSVCQSTLSVCKTIGKVEG